jgi:predicted transcriptional regulator
MRMLVGGTIPTQEEMARLLRVSQAYILRLEGEVTRLDMKLKECEEQLATNNQNNDGYKRLG